MLDHRERRAPCATPTARRYAIRPTFLRRCRCYLGLGVVIAVAAIIALVVESALARTLAWIALVASAALAYSAWRTLRGAGHRAVEIGPDGVRADDGELLRWTELAGARERGSLGRLDLLDSRGRTRVQLDHQLDRFAEAVEAVVAGRTSVAGFDPTMTFRGRALGGWSALATRVLLAAVPAAGWAVHWIRDPRWAFGLAVLPLLSTLEFVRQVQSLRVTDETVTVGRVLGRQEIPTRSIVSCELTPPTLRDGSVGVVLHTTTGEHLSVLPRGADVTAVCAAVRSVCPDPEAAEAV